MIETFDRMQSVESRMVHLNLIVDGVFSVWKEDEKGMLTSTFDVDSPPLPYLQTNAVSRSIRNLSLSLSRARA